MTEQRYGVFDYNIAPQYLTYTVVLAGRNTFAPARVLVHMIIQYLRYRSGLLILSATTAANVSEFSLVTVDSFVILRYNLRLIEA